jgi:glutathione S-transferase
MTSSKPVPPLVLCELGESRVPQVESFSPFCLKVHRTLKYLGLPYERRHGMPGAFKKLYRTGQVPVLVIGEEAVGDSTDIIRRVQEVTGRTFPALDAKLAAEAVLWEEFADTALANFVVASRFADERNWPAFRDVILKGLPGPLRPLIGSRVRKQLVHKLVERDVWRAGPEVCWRRFGEQLDALEARAPESGYWLGTFSVADIAVFSMLQSMRVDITQWQRGEIAKRARLSRYLDRVDEATRGTQAPAAPQAASAVA